MFSKDSNIFLKNRVGVIISGAVDVRKHQNTNIMKPFKVYKATEGDIIGFAEGDEGMTCNPLTWLVAMQDYTEVIFFEPEPWEKLWKL